MKVMRLTLSFSNTMSVCKYTKLLVDMSCMIPKEEIIGIRRIFLAILFMSPLLTFLQSHPWIREIQMTYMRNRPESLPKPSWLTDDVTCRDEPCTLPGILFLYDAMTHALRVMNKSWQMPHLGQEWTSTSEKPTVKRSNWKLHL